MEPKVDEILKRIQNKKSILLENKLLYSKKTDELSVENQFYSKVSKVIKKQNSNIKKSTKIYINNCVKRALYEAELEYSQDILSNLSNNKQHEDEINEVNEYRNKLENYLDDYRQCRQQFHSTRREITSESTRMKQSCLDTAFYCQDLKTKLTHDLKKSLHSKSNYENIKSTKLYHKYLNETISLLADRVLDSRQELKGYFKNQVMKLQREQRIMEETEAANKLKEKLIAEENGMSTKEEVDRYLKANKLFGADKEDNGNQNIEPHNPSSPRSAISSTPNSKLTPKPPSLMPNSSLSPRPGNLVGMTAAARRKIRGTQSTAMNLDDICEELLQVCQLDGKRYRLETLKKMLQGHVMYQLCFLTLVQSDLLKINQQHQTTPQTDLPPPPPYPPSLQQDISNNSDRSALGNEGNPIVVGTIPSTVPQGTVPKSKKLGIRHVYLKDNLRMCDEDDSEDENVSRKIQYVSTGLTYAQSLCYEIEGLESEVMRLNQINQNNLEIHSNQSHEKEKIQELKKLHESMVEKLSLTSSDRDGENGDEFNSDGLPPSLPSSQTNSPSSTRLLRKTFGPSDDNIGGMNKSKGRGMQAGMISQINKQKERDRERELKYKEEKNKQRKSFSIEEIENNGISLWCKEDKLKDIFIDILVSELNSSTDIPLELGFVKLSSMNLMSINSDQHESTSTNSNHQHQTHRRKSSSTSAQHRVLLIEGLGTL